MYITYGGNGLCEARLAYSDQLHIPKSLIVALYRPTICHYYNSCHNIKGNSMAAISEEDTKGEELSLSGSPIWNLQAGEDIFPSPPCDQAKTLKKYHLPGDRSVMVASKTWPM